MLVKMAASPLFGKLKTGFKNFAKSVGTSEAKANLFESGMLVPTIALGDGALHATLFHEKGQSRAKEFGKGALGGALAGAVIGGGDVLAHNIVEYGRKTAKGVHV